MNLLEEYLNLNDNQKPLFVGYLSGYVEKMLDKKDIECIKDFIKELKKLFKNEKNNI